MRRPPLDDVLSTSVEREAVAPIDRVDCLDHVVVGRKRQPPSDQHRLPYLEPQQKGVLPRGRGRFDLGVCPRRNHPVLLDQDLVERTRLNSWLSSPGHRRALMYAVSTATGSPLASRSRFSRKAFSPSARCSRSRSSASGAISLNVSTRELGTSPRARMSWLKLRNPEISRIRSRATNVPLPCCLNALPCRTSSSRALLAVILLTLYFLLRSASEGSRSPGWSAPRSSCSSMSSWIESTSERGFEIAAKGLDPMLSLRPLRPS